MRKKHIDSINRYHFKVRVQNSHKASEHLNLRAYGIVSSCLFMCTNSRQSSISLCELKDLQVLYILLHEIIKQSLLKHHLFVTFQNYLKIFKILPFAAKYQCATNSAGPYRPPPRTGTAAFPGNVQYRRGNPRGFWR
jgi:hypothetical protein